MKLSQVWQVAVFQVHKEMEWMLREFYVSFMREFESYLPSHPSLQTQKASLYPLGKKVPILSTNTKDEQWKGCAMMVSVKF